MHCMSFGTESSDKLFVTHGDPQGSVLGCFMFLFYTKDLPSVIRSSKVALYDTILYHNPSNPDELESALDDILQIG